MIDEYESAYAPDTDMGPRNPNEEIGEFSSLAFIKKKTFLKNPDAQSDAAKKEQMEMEKKLRAENKRRIEVVCNTALIARSKYVFTMNLSDKVYQVFDLISDSIPSKRRINIQKFIVLESCDDMVIGSRVNKEREDMFGGYDAFGQDIRLVESEMLVRNLKSNKIEIREKIFVDKAVSKQLEVTLEERRELSKLNAKKNGNERTGSFEDYEKMPEEKKTGPAQFRNLDDFLFG